MKNKLIYVISICCFVLSLAFFVTGCGNHGTVEGTLNGTYYNFKHDTYAFIGSNNAYASSYYGSSYMGSSSYGSSMGSSATIYIGDVYDYNSMEITIYDLYAITPYTYQDITRNYQIELNYNNNGQSFTSYAAGGQIYFDRIGYYYNDKVSGYFEAYFPEGTLYGDFDAKLKY
ncbi:MAG: hypothetical protein ABIA04_15845 [Pseudomonadota bacterium]